MTIDLDRPEEQVSAQEFEALTPFSKGILVYYFGSRDDQPNIPERYDPGDEADDREQYERGLAHGAMLAQDSEE